MKQKHFLVLDIGTTAIKACVFDSALNLAARTSYPLKKSFPQAGWVEQSPKELVKISQKALWKTFKASKLKPTDFLGLAVTNQRETTILWDKKTGLAVYPAIVWEDLRTRKFCQKLSTPYSRVVRQKTGLTIDSYFSATKIRWILDNVPAASKLAAAKQLLFGTVDAWILWNFTGQHATDYTNASRTLLFNIKTLQWDKELLEIFGVPAEILPKVKFSAANFGALKKDILGFSLPVLAVCGDQQASFYSAWRLAKYPKAVTKVTYGTGTFIMQGLDKRFLLKDGLFTTLAPGHGRAQYVLEGKIARGGKQAEVVMNNPRQLHKFLQSLTKDVNVFLKKLPLQPEEIIIDGGVSRFPELAYLQARAGRAIVRKQKIYDGTALGAAMLAAGL